MSHLIEAMLRQKKVEYDAAEGESADYIRTVMLFGVLKLCSDSGAPVPHWATEKLAEAVAPWLGLEIASLDEAFGVRQYSETALREMKRDNKISRDSFARIRTLGRSLDAGELDAIPWKDLAKEYGVSKTKLQDLYHTRAKLFPKIERKPR